MANRDAAVAAKQMAKKCQKVCERVFDHQFKVANLLDQRQKNYSIHCQHVNALRDQIDAADPIDRGSERLFAVRLRLEFEVKMIPTMMASVMQTFRKLGVWDRRAERRRNEWRELLGEMNERYDECEKLLQEGGKIQAGLDGMEKRLGLVAGPGMNVKRGYSLDGKRYTYRHKEVVESAGVGAGDGSGVEGDRANGLDVLS